MALDNDGDNSRGEVKARWKDESRPREREKETARHQRSGAIASNILVLSHPFPLFVRSLVNFTSDIRFCPFCPRTYLAERKGKVEVEKNRPKKPNLLLRREGVTKYSSASENLRK